MRRGSKLTLYELMTQADGNTEAGTATRQESGSRVLRVPMGYAWAGGAILVVLMFVAYLVGFQRGGRSAEASMVQDRIEAEDSNRLLQQAYEVEPEAPVKEAPALTAGSGTPVQETTVASDPAPPPTGVGAGDPRTSGLNYYVICHPSEDKVAELIRFCRSNGLDAHRVSTRNGNAKVIVTPGFPSGGSGSEDILALKTRIRQVGILWKRHDQGQNEDFSTYYAEKYQPRAASSVD